MRYQWAPLLRDGGERRLNVAATRAKHRLTLVSSFSSRDVDPDRVTKAGARLLADYLEYAGSGGTAHLGLVTATVAKFWGLEVNQDTPDFDAIEALLKARYRYWDDDSEHTSYFTRHQAS
ncbi:MAG TPA: hypothetical protein VNF47_06665 [Streptosporangiaceae bacterium]|nr:hypothetical protein [Streptosporangiaceae bacterium]